MLDGKILRGSHEKLLDKSQIAVRSKSAGDLKVKALSQTLRMQVQVLLGAQTFPALKLLQEKIIYL